VPLEEEVGAEEELPGLVEELAGAVELLSAGAELAVVELFASTGPQEPSERSDAAARMKRNLFLDIKGSFLAI